MGNQKFKIMFTTTDTMERILGLLENLDAVFELHIEPAAPTAKQGDNND